MSENAKGKLGDLWGKIKDEVVDLATVDVTTLEGTVELKLTADNVFDLDELFKALKGSIKPDGSSLTLVAHTHVDFDLDAVMITKPDASSSLMDAHNKAVKTAVDARKSVLNLAKEAAGITS